MDIKDPADTSADGRARAYRTLALALLGSAVLIAVAATFVLGSEPEPWKVTWLLAIPVLGAVVLHLVMDRIGYRVAPLDPAADEAARTAAAFQGWQASAVLRFAVSEALLLFCMTLAMGGRSADSFLTSGALALLWVSAACTLALLTIHVLPTRRPVLKVSAVQESEHARSPLPEAFGVHR